MDSNTGFQKTLRAPGGNYVPRLRWSHQESLLTTALSSSEPLREQQLAMSPYHSSTSTTIEFEEDEAEVFDKLLSPKLLQLFHPAVSKVKAKSVTNLAPSVSGHGERKGIFDRKHKGIQKRFDSQFDVENFQSGPCEMLRFLLDEEGKRG